MNNRVKVLILAGAVLGAAALAPAVSEGRGGGGGGRGGSAGGRGLCGQNQQQCQQLNSTCAQDRQQLRDGSCGNTACPQAGQRGPGAAPQGGTVTPPVTN